MRCAASRSRILAHRIISVAAVAFQNCPEAAEYADPGRTPQRGGGIEAADVHAIAHNHPCPKKADTGDDLRCNTPRAVRRGRHRAENKHRRAGGHRGHWCVNRPYVAATVVPRRSAPPTTLPRVNESYKEIPSRLPPENRKPKITDVALSRAGRLADG